MGIERSRNEEYFINVYSLDHIEGGMSNKQIVERAKYLEISLSNIDELSNKIDVLLNNGVSFNNKQIIIRLNTHQYLSTDQIEKLFKQREKLEEFNAQLKIKDGDFWELEDVISAASKLDEVANQVNGATLLEDGKKRQLNELEKFLWIYSYVANRKYQENTNDLDSSRHITSILKTGDCVCVGFAQLLKCLCDKVGIECYYNSCQVMEKIGEQEFGHANNFVVINGKAYHCDACFDCVCESRPKSVLSHCLLPVDDANEYFKTEIYNHTAPFAKGEVELKEFKKILHHINSADNVQESDYKEAMRKLAAYTKIMPQYQPTATELFSARDYKKELIFHFSNAVELLSKRIATKPIEVEAFEQALINIYVASGKTEQTAKRKTAEIINNTINYSGKAFNETASNSFKAEYKRIVNI